MNETWIYAGVALLIVVAVISYGRWNLHKSEQVEDRFNDAYLREMRRLFEEDFRRNPEAYQGTLRYEQYQQARSLNNTDFGDPRH